MSHEGKPRGEFTPQNGLDREIWVNIEQDVLSALNKPQPLSLLGHFEELYRRVTPAILQENLPDKQAAYWRCGCGRINTNDRQDCISCGYNLEKQLLGSDIAGLEKQLAIEIEHKKEQERAEREQHEIYRLKKKRILRVLYPTIALVIILALIYTAWKNSNLGKYTTAVAQLKSGSYHEAVRSSRKK